MSATRRGYQPSTHGPEYQPPIPDWLAHVNTDCAAEHALKEQGGQCNGNNRVFHVHNTKTGQDASWGRDERPWCPEKRRAIYRAILGAGFCLFAAAAWFFHQQIAAFLHFALGWL